LGAGLLGFAINPPASLYYVQGLNMTPAHGHAALFGVYGMLGIGLMLFCLRGLYARKLHADRYLACTFWGLNAGLAMMVFMSLLPAGIYQAAASVSQGLWFARRVRAQASAASNARRAPRRRHAPRGRLTGTTGGASLCAACRKTCDSLLSPTIACAC
jgi:nitric oxide reductase large subunit